MAVCTRTTSSAFAWGRCLSAWRKLDVEDARLAFRDDSANATVAVNARCGLDADDVPLASLTQHLFLQFTDRAQTSQAKVSLDGREALRTEISAALDGVKKQYLVYVLKKNGCVYDFMYIAADSAVRLARGLRAIRARLRGARVKDGSRLFAQ